VGCRRPSRRMSGRRRRDHVRRLRGRSRSG
jgi:hypothetical protein